MPSPPSRLPHLISSLTVLDSIYYTVNAMLALRHVARQNKVYCQIEQAQYFNVSASFVKLSSAPLWDPVTKHIKGSH